MLQYLIILLDDTSSSFCHYEVPIDNRKIISIEVLRKGIRYAMMHDLNIQVVYPDYEIPEDYKKELEKVEHCNIVPSNLANHETDVVIVNNWDFTKVINLRKSTTIRTSKELLWINHFKIYELLKAVPNVNVVILDVDKFEESDYEKYNKVLLNLTERITELYCQGYAPQLNLLTDRMILNNMNNCNAGDISITLAPNGYFYICPAFYYEDIDDNIGYIDNDIYIKNNYLYLLDHAPICCHCDAYQCKRCLWLNRKTTLEINTPSHEQCVIAHLERNASRYLLNNIRKHGDFLPDRTINEIDYLDPFEKRELWN